MALGYGHPLAITFKIATDAKRPLRGCDESRGVSQPPQTY